MTKAKVLNIELAGARGGIENCLNNEFAKIEATGAKIINVDSFVSANGLNCLTMIYYKEG